MLSMLIYFSDRIGMNNFKANAFTKFTDNIYGSLSTVDIDEVFVHSEDDGIDAVEKTSGMIGQENLLPGCILCLEKIDSEITNLEIPSTTILIL